MRSPYQCLGRKSVLKCSILPSVTSSVSFRKSCWCYFWLSASILWITVSQYPIKWVYIFQEVAREPLACILCSLRNILTILTILTVKKKLIQADLDDSFQVEKRKISQCCLSLTFSLAKVCLQGLPQRRKCKRVCRRACSRSVKCKHVFCSIHTLIPKLCCSKRGFCSRIL